MQRAAQTLRLASSRLVPQCSKSFVSCRGSLPLNVRTFSSAGGKVIKVLESELKHEEEQYEQPKEIKNFLKSGTWKLVEAEGDVNMVLEREVGGKTVKIEFQLASPMMPEKEGEEDSAATEFSVTAEAKNGSGLTFFCSTQAGEDHRYVIGNVKSYATAEEKDSMTSYNGPEFEDLDDKLQEALDEYLGELGMNSEICDFVDAMASDKEQREYVRWLGNTKKAIE
eukprot:TRINITY_DN977_c0_g5_i1.p1 TRINITY_DN977_c0_g5~~TRINITY_DN977_c0_g5_i1.p1  ORF type:complete len:244 (-),score=62.08 TRINITY_DN977_c0_g5_i1:196-870(-)